MALLAYFSAGVVKTGFADFQFGFERGSPHEGLGMKKFSVFFLFAILLAVAGGAAFLATWDIPAPTAQVERVLPDDRFPQ